MPNHIAIVPDGNRRWAKLHDVSPLEGHQAGAKTMHGVVEHLLTCQVKYLTVWGFSTDNWKRSQVEIDSLFQLLAQWIERDTPWLNSHNVALRYIGRIGELPQFLKLAIRHSVAFTRHNSGLTLNLAFNYSGRAEIIDAINQLLDERVPRHIDEETFTRNLYTGGMPDVDLVIRTAGEVRLSNFLLWQTAYSEYYFTDVLWPDFDEKELEKALQVYRESQRRFGGD